MLNIIICEDNVTINNQIKTIISTYLESSKLKGNIQQFVDNYENVVSYAAKNIGINNIYFLDIGLSEEINGLTLAKEIRKKDLLANIIFITGHPELSLKVLQYKLKVLDYIYKGDGDLEKRIFECLDVIRKEVIEVEALYQNEGKLLVRSGSSYHQIFFDDILFLETDTLSRKISIYTLNERIEIYDTLKNLENQLNENFYRCHRACIVNLKHIKTIHAEKSNSYILVTNNYKCLLSQKYVKGLLCHVESHR